MVLTISSPCLCPPYVPPVLFGIGRHFPFELYRCGSHAPLTGITETFPVSELDMLVFMLLFASALRALVI
jgi:hypothetical protein